MMEQISLALGPGRVSCLTGVTSGTRNGLCHDGIRVYRRPGAFSGSVYKRSFNLSLALAGIILRESPHVVQLSTCQEGNLGLLIKRWWNIPFVLYAHGNELFAARETEWDKPRLALDKASRILANSRFTADLAEKAGARPESITVIPLGCDTDRFRPREVENGFRNKVLGSREKGPVILTVGNLAERKGHDMIIRALPEVTRKIPGVTYVIVGGGPPEHEKGLRELANASKVGDQVVFAGRVPDAELPSYYALCDVFAMPSRIRPDSYDVEGFGIVYLEAGASGKPVVGGRAGGVEDAVAHGATGLLVNPDDVLDIGQALIRLLDDAELRHRMGSQARERVLRGYTWSVVGERVRKILEEVANE